MMMTMIMIMMAFRLWRRTLSAQQIGAAWGAAKLLLLRLPDLHDLQALQDSMSQQGQAGQQGRNVQLALEGAEGRAAEGGT